PDEALLGRGGRSARLAELAPALARVEARLGVAPTLDRLRQLALLVGGEKGHETDLVEVLANRITHDKLLNHRYRDGIPRNHGFSRIPGAGYRGRCGVAGANALPMEAATNTFGRPRCRGCVRLRKMARRKRHEARICPVELREVPSRAGGGIGVRVSGETTPTSLSVRDLRSR